MDFVTGLASNAICCICTGLYNQIKNLIHLGGDVHEMESLLTRLQARKRHIDEWLERERRIPFPYVENWRGEVDSLQPTAESITTHFALHKRCLAGCCPNCIFRLNLSRRVHHCKSEIQELLRQFESLNGVYGEAPALPISEDRPVAAIVGESIEDAQRQIEDWLKKKDDGTVIAVYGMGGVGKTTLLTNINNGRRVREEFELVIWVTVSQNPDIEKLQDSIASRLRCDLREYPTVEARGGALYRSSKDKKSLLILDDMWTSIDAHNLLGVSERTKILLSTRNLGVCTSMGAGGHIVKLEPLSEDEGWELFRRKAFKGGDFRAIEGIARQIAAECKGLPLAINVVAGAMPNNSNPSQWRAALDALKGGAKDFYELHGDIEQHLFRRLKWSYDALPSHHLKICFLLCAAFPEDSQISAEELIRCWISEGLVKVRDDEYLVDKGFSVIVALRDRSLIQTTEPFDHLDYTVVTVHDILRDFALRIGEMDEKEKCLFRAGQSVEDFPPEEVTRPCRRISLMRNQISTLPPNFQCEHLVSLMLAHNRGIREIPDNFLTNLPSLKLLDLSCTELTSLPVHFGSPNQLVYLDLSGTHITELPGSIADLHSLQFLALTCCPSLKSVSSRICELKFLRSLNIYGCLSLRVIPREIFEVASLEILEMNRNRVSGRVREESLSEETHSNEIYVSDLAKLKHLRHLSFSLNSPLTNGVMGKWKKMRRLALEFEDDANQRDIPDDLREMKELEHFSITKCSVERVPDCICALQYLQCLSFIGCPELRELTGLERLPQLRTLVIQRCDGLSALGAGFGRAEGFPMLERLSLFFLHSLWSVVGECGVGEGVLEDGALQSLKRLTIFGCPRLRSLPRGMENLNRLEKIKVSPDKWLQMAWVDESIKIHLGNFLVYF